jgi:hypothetical protein
LKDDLKNVEPGKSINEKSEVDIWVIVSAIAIIFIPVGMIIYLNPHVTDKILDIIRIIIGPLVGAFAGVFLGFRKNSQHQEELNHKKKLLLLKILRHEVKKSIDLLQDPSGYLIPFDAWNSIVYSGNIVVFEHTLSTKLGDIYFDIQNYNYEAKRTRDASERFNSSAEPYQRKSDMETLDHKNWRMTKERWERLSKNLVDTTKNVRFKLIELEKNKWFNEGMDESSN